MFRRNYCLCFQDKKTAVFWEITKDNNLLCMYTKIVTGEYSVSPFKLYAAVMRVHFRYQFLVGNTNVSSKYFIFKALTSIDIYFLSFDPI